MSASQATPWRSMKVDKNEALDVALGQIERQFGKGSVMKMNDRAAVSVGAVSTGSLALDLALGIGGLPRGRIIEVFGPESSGKTTLVYHVIAEAQRRGGICAFIDAEHSMDPAYAKRIGVDIDNLLVSQPDTGEQALEITELLIRSGALDVVAIDSVAALTPKAEIEGGEEQGRAAVQAGRVRHHLRLRHLVGRHGSRHRNRPQGRREVGLVLQLRRRAARPGTAERDRIPARASRRDAADPPAHPARARPGTGRLRATAAGRRGGGGERLVQRQGRKGGSGRRGRRCRR